MKGQASSSQHSFSPFNAGLPRSLASVLHKIRALLSRSEEDVSVESGLWADFLVT